MQGSIASSRPSQQVEDDEEKAALRQHIQQLEEANARAEWQEPAASSQLPDEERLEAALQQAQLQERIRQLEVLFLLLASVMYVLSFN